jgi:hypothetical protein
MEDGNYGSIKERQFTGKGAPSQQAIVLSLDWHPLL